MLKRILLILLIFISTHTSANELISVLKHVNKLLEEQKIKVEEYSESKTIEGYELTLSLNKNSKKYTPKKIYLNKNLDSMIMVYKEDEISENIKDKEKIDIAKAFNKIYNTEDPINFPKEPLFKKETQSTYNDSFIEYHTSEKSFTIDSDKKYIIVGETYFFNGEKFVNNTSGKRKIFDYEIREKIKNIYEKQSQITLIPNNMNNMIVVFYSHDMRESEKIFERATEYNEKRYGLLFLPYFNLEEDMKNSKDYQIFCQEDFALSAEYRMLNTTKLDIGCPSNNEEAKIKSQERLLDIYKASQEIKDYFYLDKEENYYYLYKEQKMVTELNF